MGLEFPVILVDARSRDIWPAILTGSVWSLREFSAYRYWWSLHHYRQNRELVNDSLIAGTYSERGDWGCAEQATRTSSKRNM